MPEIVVADRQALRVVAQLMRAHQTQRTGEPDLHAHIDQDIFEPGRAFETVVNELAMAAERMAEQQHRAGREEEDQQARPGEEQAAADHGRCRHAEEPQRFRRRVHHRAFADARNIRGRNAMLLQAFR
jgi:hypothetical protein